MFFSHQVSTHILKVSLVLNTNTKSCCFLLLINIWAIKGTLKQFNTRMSLYVTLLCSTQSHFCSLKCLDLRHKVVSLWKLEMSRCVFVCGWCSWYSNSANIFSTFPHTMCLRSKHDQWSYQMNKRQKNQAALVDLTRQLCGLFFFFHSFTEFIHRREKWQTTSLYATPKDPRPGSEQGTLSWLP